MEVLNRYDTLYISQVYTKQVFPSNLSFLQYPQYLVVELPFSLTFRSKYTRISLNCVLFRTEEHGNICSGILRLITEKNARFFAKRKGETDRDMENAWSWMLESLTRGSSYKDMFGLLKCHGDAVAAEILDENGSVFTRSYDTYIRMTEKACGQLERSGFFGQGDVVGLCCETCMDWPVLFWGILMSGGIPLLLNPAADGKLLGTILREADAKAIVSQEPREGVDIPCIRISTVLEDGEPGIEQWADAVALCTSGTTGASRIFLYTGQTVANQLQSFDEAAQNCDELPFVEGVPCRILAFLPFHHVFGFTIVYMIYSLTGKTIVYLRDKSVRTIMEACRTHHVTNLYNVPMFFNALAAGIMRQVPDPSGLPEALKQEIRKNCLGTDMRIMITGGGHVPARTLQVLNDIGYPLHNGFGMTECGVICVELSGDPEQRKKGSIGNPFQGNEVSLGLNETGELKIRSHSLYAASIVEGKRIPRDPEEWFETGDIMRRDSDGFYIVGRVKDVIIGASGENIYPDELEDRFAGLPGVTAFCVLGVKNGFYDDLCLLLEPADEGFSESALSAAIDKIRESLGTGEQPGRILISGAKLPVSASMKIMRQTLKKKIEDGSWPYRELHRESRKAAPVMETVTAAAEPEDPEFVKISDTIRKIVSDTLYIDEEQIGDYDSFTEKLAGDSLTLFGVFCEIEKQFDLVLADSDMVRMQCVHDAAAMIYERLYGKNAQHVNTHQEEKSYRRITNFSESPEYQDLMKRSEETFKGGENPYFLPHDSLIRDTSVIREKRVINLGSYNYLGMSGNPETMDAAVEAIKKYGTSASGSRTLAGEKTLYQQLERTIADWKHTEDCIVCTGGWATNLSFISCFMREGDFILYDALSHNSITEGVALSKAESRAFAHNDLAMLEDILKKISGKYNKVLIVVEGVYSMDGDIAPVPEFVRLKKEYGCFLMVDEAHSGGVIGDHAGGCDDYFHLEPHDIDIKYGTMSKALGACGGYIAADHSIVEYLRYSMNGFVFTAGIAPPLAAAVMKAIELIQRDNTMAKKLHENIHYFVRRCKEEGMNTCLAGESAIVPVMVGTDADAARLSSEILKRGVFVPPAMFPAVPMGESRLRFTISATHSIEQLEKAVTVTAEVMRKEGFLK